MNRTGPVFVAAALALTGSTVAQTTLVACGTHNLNLVMEQVPTTWWSWQEHNDAMWLWNQYVDIYRYTADNGTWGRNGANEFAGFPSNADLNSTWGFTWGPSTLAMTVTSWSCQCCNLSESDVAFNPAASWTTDPVAAETNSSLTHFQGVLLHELGHSWGLQTINENYDYGVPTVMHAYYGNSVHPGLTIHASDAYLIRRHYASQRAQTPRADMAVFSQYAVTGLINTTTNVARVQQGAPLTVRNITVENTGDGATANAHIRLYLSTNRTISTGDTLIGDWFWTSFNAEGWGAYNLTGTVPLTTPTGSYFVGAIVSSNGYGGDDFAQNDTTHLFSQVLVDPRPCADDAFEPNNSMAAPAAIGTGFYGGLQVCQGNDDWYRILVPAGNRLDLSIQFTHANGDLDLQLYDASSNLVDGSYSVTDGESVTIASAPTSGFYFARVYGFLNAQNTYSLQSTVDVYGECAFRNGTGVNGTGYHCVTNPVLGSTWQSQVTINGATIMSYVAVGGVPDPGTPLLGGEVLVGGVFVTLDSAAGNHSVLVPNTSAFLGARFYSQAFRVDAPGGTPRLILLNAQDLRCGH